MITKQERATIEQLVKNLMDADELVGKIYSGDSRSDLKKAVQKRKYAEAEWKSYLDMLMGE